MTIHEHLKRYPNARPSTLVYLENREATTEKLRKEIGMDDESDRRARMLAEGERETVLGRLIRKLRRA